MKYAEVYINIKTPGLKQPFDYIVPDKFAGDIKLGSIVAVSFNNRKEVGFISRIKNYTKISNLQLKEIEDVLKEFQFIDFQRLKLIYWMSVYYSQPFSKIVQFFIPPVDNKDFHKILNNPGKYMKYFAAGKKADTENDDPGEISNKPDFNSDNTEQINLDNNENIEKIMNCLRAGDFRAFLIRDILQSEKTSLINKLSHEALMMNKSTIILTPEISAAENLYNKLSSSLKSKACIYHSDKKKSDRFKIWNDIFTKKYSILLGTRSAVFLPVRDAGLLILDEEHDTSYKDGTIVRYNTQDIAIKLCKLLKIPLIFFSNTPSIKALFSFKSKDKFKEVIWDNQIHSFEKINKIIIDLRKIDTDKDDITITKELHRNINKELIRNKKVFIFVNKTGYSNFLVCRKCGYIPKCNKCNTSLKFHHSSNFLLCPHCSNKIAFSGICEKCNSSNLSFKGTGIEKIELLFNKRFPDISTVRIDSYNINRLKKDNVNISDSIKGNNPCIIIGTQAISNFMPGWADNDYITLAAIIDFDNFFLLPDFHVNERAYQLLDKIKSLLSKNTDSKLIIQTYNPESIVLNAFTSNNLNKFYSEELRIRKELSYPPFTSIINIIFSGKNDKSVVKHIEIFTSEIEKIKNIEFFILGPSPSPYQKINLFYRWHLIVKTREIIRFNLKLFEIVKNFRKDKDIKIIIDVDPVWIL